MHGVSRETSIMERITSMIFEKHGNTEIVLPFIKLCAVNAISVKRENLNDF